MCWAEAMAVQSLAVSGDCFSGRRQPKCAHPIRMPDRNISRHKRLKTNNFQLQAVLNKHQAFCALVKPSTRRGHDFEKL